MQSRAEGSSGQAHGQGPQKEDNHGRDQSELTAQLHRARLTFQEHPWVTRQGTDPLLAKSENVAIIIDPPTDEEVNAAITGNMGHLVTVVGARLPYRMRKHWYQSIVAILELTTA